MPLQHPHAQPASNTNELSTLKRHKCRAPSRPAKPIESNERQVWTATGKYRMQGASNQCPKLHVWQTTWANVDEKLGLVARASRKMSYLENHSYERARLQQELAANYLAAVGTRKAGEIISEAVLALLPNVTHTQTQDLRMEHVGADGFSVRIGGWQMLVNLGDSEIDASRSGPALKLIALSATVQKADD
ncbi:MAG: hypothetical protein EXS24_00250 [Pedosphaera sp.]|nr:hypothetical protein [Pedosphaera sp.]